MRKVYHNLLIFVPLLLIVALSACEKVIDIDLNESEPRLVVEGAITLRNGPYLIKLTTSGDFFTGDGIAPVSDADVSVSSSDGQSETLLGLGDGIYITRDLQAVPYTAYTLKVMYKDEEYTATDTLYDQVNIEELSYSVSELGKGGPDGSDYENHYDILCKFKDDTDKRNYYLLQISINGVEITGMRGKYYLLSDEYLNGEMISYPFLGIGANVNDTVKISLSAIGPATYDYFRTLNDALSQGGMGSTPYNPISNVSNNALGFFGTFTFDSESIIIKKNQ